MALLGWRGATTDAFTRVAMFDDGQHQDGTAGDGVFGASFTALTPRSEYYIYSENSSAGAFLPVRAEHEFFHLETGLSAPNAGEVVINEFLADNTAGATDPAGELEDWIELYNNTAFEVNLTGLYLSDNPDNPSKWAFPSGTVIPAHGYLIVWADEDGSQTGLHANFKLKASGEFVSLATSDGAILDSLSFGEQDVDRSFGRYPNGTGSFTDMPPTFAAENMLTTAVGNVHTTTANLSVYPNPAADQVQVSVSEKMTDVEIRLLDARGRLLQTKRLEAFTATDFSVANLSSGVYFLFVCTDGNLVCMEKLLVE